MKRLLFLILITTLSTLNAQTPRETRAVWVSTNFRLDWPPKTFDEAIQKNALIKIFDNIEKKNLNTIYFQVRSNGTVMFRSSAELFTPYITGNIGEFGNYDPLEFAVEEAHKRGLEIHAWINTFRIFSGYDISIKNSPLHITKIHPEWILKTTDVNSVWLNPGIPEVREYLVELINEIVQNYEVDGIHLDFIRYPQSAVNDKNSFHTYGNGKSLQEWRRENITKFISKLNSRIKESNPKIKLGVTPIGIYKSIPNGRGMESYSDVFQNTREWLKQGIIDYAVPQIYWDSKSNPKFDALVKDWVNNSFGRNIVIGIAAYKPEVYKELERQINTTRNLNASGVAFFRYKNIRQKRFYSFSSKALPAEMPWIEFESELSKLNLSSNFENNKITLSIHPNKRQLTDNGYFALYEKENQKNNSAGKLIKIIPNYINKISFTLSQPNKINYYYSAIEFDRLWNEASKTSNVTVVTVPKLNEILNDVEQFKNPLLLQKKSNSTIILFSDIKDKITLIENSKNMKEKKLATYFLQPGYNLIITNINLTKYNRVIIEFENSERSVEIKTN